MLTAIIIALLIKYFWKKCWIGITMIFLLVFIYIIGFIKFVHSF